MGKISDLTGFLFADPSFLGGVAASVDMGGTLVEYNQSQTGQEADYRAMASDWAAVGCEISVALNAQEQEAPKASKQSADRD